MARHVFTTRERLRAGRLGGAQVASLYGSRHMAAIGRAGGRKGKTEAPADVERRVAKIVGEVHGVTRAAILLRVHRETVTRALHRRPIASRTLERIVASLATLKESP